MAIRSRITSTSRPDASVMIAKPRSPSGRRCSRGRADPAGMAGSAFVTVLTTPGPRVLPASQCSWRSYPVRSGRSDLVELGLGLCVQASWQRRVAQGGEYLLPGAEQVADVGLEHLRGVRARLALDHQVPGLVGDRVGVRAGSPDRVERQVRLDDGALRGRGRGLR